MRPEHLTTVGYPAATNLPGGFIFPGTAGRAKHSRDFAERTDCGYSLAATGEKDRRMQKKVLIVDDSHMIRRIVGKILKEDNFEVLIAENGLMGYEMAKANLPDLVIMDVEMPIMTGIEATSKIRSDAVTTHIPVLIFTSLGDEKDIRMAKEAGGSGFLNKPISKEELRTTIFSILGADAKGSQ